MKTYTHWLVFDPSRKDAIRKTLSRSSGFAVTKLYCHPKPGLSVAEIVSPFCYNDLPLSVNSISSPFKRATRKPEGIFAGKSVESFERIYGTLGFPTEIRIAEENA